MPQGRRPRRYGRLRNVQECDVRLPPPPLPPHPPPPPPLPPPPLSGVPEMAHSLVEAARYLAEIMANGQR
jgi:hypothetical protein